MESDTAFYSRRLREEMRRAQTSNDEGLRALHARWAELYRARLQTTDRRGRNS